MTVVELPEHASAPRHNADSKWGATFYYWDPYDLPDYSAPPTHSPWGPGSQEWWDEIVRRAAYAGFGWLAANSWGYGSNADPASLGSLVTGIRNGGTAERWEFCRPTRATGCLCGQAARMDTLARTSSCTRTATS